MAEILAVVASGMGVASLAIQVAISVEKLKNFCDRVKSTPSEIRDTLDDIGILSIVIDEIEAMARSGECLPQSLHTALLRSAKRCLEASDALRSIVAEVEAAVQKHKLRGAVKGALKKKNLDEIRQRLECAKMTCLLVGQSHQRQQNENISTSLLVLQQSVHAYSECPPTPSKALPAPPKECSTDESTPGKSSVTPFSSYPDQNKSLWGFYEVCHITRPARKRGIPGRKVGNIQSNESQTLIIAQPPYWLCQRRFDLYTSKSYSGWDFSLNVYNVRPLDAPIFQHVTDGNIPAIKQLFEENMASPFDIDEDGYSLLHCAVSDKRSGVQVTSLRFLLECGAPIHVRDNTGFTPLLELLHQGENICFKHSKSCEFREALQYLLDFGSCPYEGQTRYGTTSLGLYSGSTEGQHMLLNSLPLQESSCDGPGTFDTLVDFLWRWKSNPLPLIRNILPNGKLSTMTEEQKNLDLLSRSMKYLCDPTNEWPAFMEELLDAGADIHGLHWANNILATPFWHLLHASGTLSTPSNSLTLASCEHNYHWKYVRGIDETMMLWLGVLEKSGYNISNYLAEEERLRQEYDQLLPDTIARVEMKASTKEVVIEREWAYLCREFDPHPHNWDWELDIPGRYPDTYRLEAFWRCVEEESEAAEFALGKLKMPGGWEE